MEVTNSNFNHECKVLVILPVPVGKRSEGPLRFHPSSPIPYLSSITFRITDCEAALALKK